MRETFIEQEFSPLFAFTSSIVVEECGSTASKGKTIEEQTQTVLPPLEDPSIILTSPHFPKSKCSDSIKSNESFDDPEQAREVINHALRDVTPTKTVTKVSQTKVG